MADPGDFFNKKSRLMKWNSVESHSWVQMTEIPQNFPCTYKPDNARTITISTLSLVRFSPGAAFIPAKKGNRLINFYLIINKSNKCLISFSPGRNLTLKTEGTALAYAYNVCMCLRWYCVFTVCLFKKNYYVVSCCIWYQSVASLT